MRKEVKLGMAIGGGLIAVLVVYLLVAPPANKSGAQLAGGGGSIIDGSQPGDSAAATGAGATDDRTAAAAATGNRNSAANSTGQAAPTPPANTVIDVQSPLSHDPAKERVAARSGDNATASGDKWSAALNKGKIDKSTESTPAAGAPTAPAAKERVAIKPAPIKHESIAQASVAPVASEPKLYVNPNDAWGGGVSTDAVFGTGTTHAAAGKTGTSHSATSAGTASAAAPAAATAAGGTHVVQSGDTLSSIAMDAYGSAAYYPHILRANPTVNPNNLKLGTVLTLPKADEVKVIASAGEHSAGERGTAALAVVQDVKIDPKTQYQVQSGDSLYKISLKIYGKPTFVERIYEKNKALIGSDPKKLKLGMILELPDKSAAAVASPRQETTSQASTEADRR
jgi:nucleoid-associated protein YgaU